MDKIIQQIEDKYVSQITQANLDLETATFNLNNLIGSKEEEKKRVAEYFNAVDQKEQAEIIIANSSVANLIK